MNRHIIDLDKLSPAERRKLTLALKPRNATLSLHFHDKDIERWKAAAGDHGCNLTDWVEKILNEAAEK